MTGLVLTSVADGIATITINRPDAYNALNFAVRAALAAAFDMVCDTPAIRCVILTGTGQKAFASGSDVKEMSSMSPIQSVALSKSIMKLNGQIASLPQPVICAINGWCLGGGLELALACDIRIAAENARLGFPEAKLGITTGGGGAPRLVKIVGAGVARHMMLTAEIISAQRAYETGLVTRVTPADALQASALEMARQIVELGPVALAQIKRILSVAESSDTQDAIDFEAQACSVCFGTEDKAEGMAALLEKRKAVFSGR